MIRAEKLLTGRLLELAAARFHEDGCTDMPAELLDGLDGPEATVMVRAFNRRHYGTDELRYQRLANIQIDQWMEYLGELLKREAESE